VESGERRWLFAFERMCEVLGIDADSARTRLLAIRPGARVDIGLRGDPGRPPRPAMPRTRAGHRCGSAAARS